MNLGWEKPSETCAICSKVSGVHSDGNGWTEPCEHLMEANPPVNDMLIAQLDVTVWSKGKEVLQSRVTTNQQIVNTNPLRRYLQIELKAGRYIIGGEEIGLFKNSIVMLDMYKRKAVKAYCVDKGN